MGVGVRGLPIFANRENITKYHAKNSVKNGKFHAKFTLLGRGASETVVVVVILRDLNPRPILSGAGTVGKRCGLRASPCEGANPSPILDKKCAPMGPKFLSSIRFGLGSGGRLVVHFQTPSLYWIDFCLRFTIGTEKP